MDKKERINLLETLIDAVENGKICCICGEPIEGFGNNPYPCVKYEGARCCDKCDTEYVIPARIAELYRKENNNGED